MLSVNKSFWHLWLVTLCHSGCCHPRKIRFGKGSFLQFKSCIRLYKYSTAHDCTYNNLKSKENISWFNICFLCSHKSLQTRQMGRLPRSPHPVITMSELQGLQVGFKGLKKKAVKICCTHYLGFFLLLHLSYSVLSGIVFEFDRCVLLFYSSYFQLILINMEAEICKLKNCQ